jgi:hypothetical protein
LRVALGRSIRRHASAVALVVVVSSTLGACSSPDGPAAPDPPMLSWSRVTLPGHVTPLTLTRMGGGLLVGARSESAHLAPRLLVLDQSGWSEIPLEPHTYYSYRAHWRSVITDGTHIYAFGDAPGGAHSNPRWTTWSGTADGVREYTQYFETFGGPGAGGLTGLTFEAGRPVVVGSWTSDDVGLDIVFWRLVGHDWVRGTSTGTVLASNQRELNVIRAIGTDATGPVLAGAVTVLGGGQVGLVPAIWRRSPETGTWARIDLPARDAGQATDAQCDGSSCLAAGYDRARLAVWSISDQAATKISHLPMVHVNINTLTLVGPAGSPRPRVLTSERGRSVLLTPGTAWTAQPGPPGVATAWALARGHLYVVTETANGTAALWVSERQS